MSGETHDASWALKLLEREPDYEQNYVAKNWAYICATAFGVAVPIGLNIWTRRPLWAGIQYHFLFGVLGFGAGHLLTERDKYVLARRDAILRDYIRLHPEDFPAPERKKIGELLEDWVPVR
ncbi:NADH dehydrogenase [ubiquinone] 1 subunit C2 [Venturia canescens]|uniref:NADH dehydrogenase [ubiquinone] 1 subunit C2 n=1 Tax=Venturia canescens TaxID=32260 RepID=UPI001C9BE934|nr:NADH dehydrogenase [ubiquinone] 1 subunit C2 [Venturia canescens]